MAEEADTLDVLLRPFVGGVRLTPETRLFHDLGLAGDDVVELLDSIKARLGTRFDDFPFYAFFPGESEALGFRLLPWRRRQKRPLTLAHLRAVIARGAWFAP